MENMEELNTNTREEIKTESTSSYNEFLRYITNIDPTNPNFEDLLINKREEIRNSYNLPSRNDVKDGKMSVEQYTLKLKDITNQNGIFISYDLERYIEETPLLKESVLSTKAITGAFVDKEEDKNNQNTIYLKKDFNFSKVEDINTFEHELIHALQYIKNPQMKIEQKELEAYLSITNNDILKKENLRNMMFSLMKGSIESYYKQHKQQIPWNSVQTS